MKSGEHWKVVPEGAKGEAQIIYFEISEHASRMTAFQGGLGYCDPGKFVKLMVKGDCVMSDTRMEYMTNFEAIGKANGHVLIAGLGLGLILGEICEKEDVKSVLVVEKSQDVIDLVLPHVKHPKLFVLCANIFEWKPEKGRKFDTIYFDIWPDMCVDFLEEMAKLHQRFKYFLNRDNPNRYMNSWSKDILLAKKREESRNPYGRW